MKKKLFVITSFFSLFLTLNLSAQTTQYVWEYVNTLQNEWLQKICTQGLDTIYIVGRNGLIAQSADRVLTWNKQYPTTTQLNDIIFCNHTIGFVVGNNGTILRTTDAGASWTKQNSSVTVNLNAIAATGTDNIWAVGDSGKVVYSTNAGVTWQNKDFSTLANLNGISFRSNVGNIVGNAHTYFVSNDYGKNWNVKDITLYNPYVTDLICINQTLNHTCILEGHKDFGTYGLFINIDNNRFVIPNNRITNFVMKNDSIGYGFNGDFVTGSTSGGIISVPIINVNEISLSTSISYQLYPLSLYDREHADVSFVNDSIEYIISGSSFFRTKRYIPVIHDGLSNAINNKLSIENNSNELTIRFENTKVGKIELYSITGLKILSENIHANETSKSLNITDLSKGIYIIRAYYRDNTFTNIKWIKQ